MIERQCDRDLPGRDNHWKLFLAVDAVLAPLKVLYPACRFDVSPSLVFPDVTYVDDGSDVAAFFGDIEGVLDIVAECSTAPQDAVFRYIRSACSRLVLPSARYDLVISLDSRPVVESCARYLKKGGWFLTHPASQDAMTLAQDPTFTLAAVVTPSLGEYRLRKLDRKPSRLPAGPSNPSTGSGADRQHDLIAEASALVYAHSG